jgi:cysteine desulfurase
VRKLRSEAVSAVRAVYLDNNATTPLDPRVREAMSPWLEGLWGNASSAHRFGQAAREAVESARAEVAALISAAPEEIVFTASGTEANNAVVAALLGAGSGGQVVLSALEHPSISRALEAWAPAAGVELRRVAPNRDGVVTAEAIGAALGAGTRFVALMLVNNEIGTIQPVAEVARLCAERGIPLLCDAVQAAGKIPLSVAELGVDYLTLGAHKFHGPLGAAALWVRPGARFDSYLVGGSQERQRRASTANVPALVGFGRACELARLELPQRMERLGALRERLEHGLASIGDVIVHGAGAPRVPHTTNAALLGTVNQELMMRLDLAGFAVSTGAACGSGTLQASATLLALGLPPAVALASLRISLGIENRSEEVDAFLAALAREVAVLRALAPAKA